MFKNLNLKLILVMFSLGFLAFSGIAHADVIINEVAWMGTTGSQYGEWVELYNDSSSDVSLANWKLYEAGGSTLIFTLSKTISANSFLVIERTTASSPDPLPSVNDESGSFGGSGLSNTGEFLVLKDANNNTADSLDFSSGWPAGDADTKDTMQKSGSAWITAMPTPDAENKTSSSSGSGNGSGNGTGETETETTTPTKTTPVVVPTIKTKITAKTTALAGLALDMQGGATGFLGETLYYGKYFWNFGDGDSTETKSIDKFTHTYFYPGDYNVILEYYRTDNLETPDATDKMTIKVTAPSVSISAVGNSSDFFVELSNSSDVDVDISKWMLVSGMKNFTFPKGTTLQAKKKMTVSSKITQFIQSDAQGLKLLFPTGEVAYNYGAPRLLARSAKSSSSLSVAKTENKIASAPTENLQVLPQSLTASVAETESGSGASSSFWIWMSGFIILLGVASGVVWFMRKSSRASSSPAGSDFKILEE